VAQLLPFFNLTQADSSGRAV